jgi:hypothetical protein
MKPGACKLRRCPASTISFVCRALRAGLSEIAPGGPPHGVRLLEAKNAWLLGSMPAEDEHRLHTSFHAGCDKRLASNF